MFDNQLTFVVIPGNVTTIGDFAFDANDDLATITIKRANDCGMTLGEDWNGPATIVFNPNYGE